MPLIRSFSHWPVRHVTSCLMLAVFLSVASRCSYQQLYHLKVFLLALEDWSRSYRGHKIMWATTKEWSLLSSVPAGTVLSGATVLTAHFSIRDSPLWNPDDFELLCYENTRDSVIYRSPNENMTAGLFYKWQWKSKNNKVSCLSSIQ